MTSPTKRDVNIRAAEANDVEAIAALGAEVFTSSFGYSLPASDLQEYLVSAYSPLSVASDLSNPNIDTIVACDDADRVVGFSQMTRGTIEDCLEGSENPVELQRLYVAQDYHGRGVGKKLIEKVEEMARDGGFVTLWLGVWEENFKAHKVYERMGFTKVGHHDFKMGTCVQRDWVLTKKI